MHGEMNGLEGGSNASEPLHANGDVEGSEIWCIRLVF